jgi:hypothetical protein
MDFKQLRKLQTWFKVSASEQSCFSGFLSSAQFCYGRNTDPKNIHEDDKPPHIWAFYFLSQFSGHRANLDESPCSDSYRFPGCHHVGGRL